eukprot:c25728_g1_i1.p1 GENE.c25728_g1_i1~~c25728_g1_i1.p1  ORF type:complete len:428 (-),score=99.49 c25728_g1_i1:123-1310(-)
MFAQTTSLDDAENSDDPPLPPIQISKAAQPKKASVRTIALLCLLNAVMWAANSISFWELGQRMEGFPLFCNWFTTLPYIVLLGPICFVRRRTRRDSFTPTPLMLHACYFAYAFFSVSDTVLELLSDSHLGGALQAVISAAVPMPLTGMLAYKFLNQKFGKWELAGSALVLSGTAIQVANSSGVQFDSFWWILVYTAGLMLGCGYGIVWQYAFEKLGARPLDMLAWGTVYSVGFDFAATFLVLVPGLVPGGTGHQTSPVGVFKHQMDGMRCVFELSPLPEHCKPGAGLWLAVYALSSMAADVVSAFLVAGDSAFFLIIADAFATPTTAALFSAKWLLGKDARPFMWYSGVAAGLTVLGMMVYKRNEVFKSNGSCDNDPATTPLLGAPPTSDKGEAI